MTETFLPGDRVSIMATVKSIHESGSGPFATMHLDGARPTRPGIPIFCSRLTLVERPVTLPVNPYDYGPDPETGRPRWEVQVYADGRGWRDVRGVSSRVGVWHFDVAGGWVSPMGKWPVRPVA
jgi:hypothetical protein